MTKRLSKPARATISSPLTRKLLELEPDLRAVSGTLVAFRTLGMSRDAIEPAAISVLAQFGEEALERLKTSWDSALMAARNQGGKK